MPKTCLWLKTDFMELIVYQTLNEEIKMEDEEEVLDTTNETENVDTETT